MLLAGLVGHVRAWIVSGLVLLVLVSAFATAWAIGRSRLTAAVYAQRLQSLCADFERLRQDYNQAVARTAVTELRVVGDTVTVLVRTAAGVVREVPTACRADREVYVDYVVLNGRLWIRRVFDAGTSPDAGTIIDPALAGVSWRATEATVGKAVYRRLEPGRWVVTVSGNGSLGLERARQDAEVELSPPPPVTEFGTLRRQVDSAQAAVSWLDLLRAALQPAPAP